MALLLACAAAWTSRIRKLRGLGLAGRHMRLNGPAGSGVLAALRAPWPPVARGRIYGRIVGSIQCTSSKIISTGLERDSASSCAVSISSVFCLRCWGASSSVG